MFEKKVKVISLRKNVMEGGMVIMTEPPTLNKLFRIEYDQTNFKDSILRLVTTLEAKNIRLLLADEITYTVNVTIPAHIQGSEERSFVYKKVLEIIPEELGSDDWDYKELGTRGDEKVVLAFAVVREMYQLIKNTLSDLDIGVEAIEPEVVALSRNSNPISGLALKKDLTGSDNKTLNISLKRKETNFLKQILDKIFG